MSGRARSISKWPLTATALLPQLRLSMAPIFLLASIFVFSVLAPEMLNSGNLTNLLGQTAPLALVALGQMVVLMTRGFDISVGSVAALSGVVAVLAANEFGNLGLVAAPLIGLGCGLVNGYVVGVLGIQPVIATLGMLSLARGLALALSDGTAVSFEGANPLAELGYGDVAGLPWSFLAVVGLALAIAVLIKRTKAGRRVVMVGSDPVSAQLVGVSEQRTLLGAYGIAGLTAGLAALFYVARAGAGLPTEGTGLELTSIAAAVIGGTALTGGVGRAWLVVVGAVFIQSLSNGLNLAGTSPFVQQVILGVVIVTAGLADRLLARLPTSQTSAGGGKV